MPHDNEGTVLQASGDDLTANQGPAGQQGQQGAAGADGLNTNILTIECIYKFNTTSNFFDTFEKNYVVEQGTRFVADGASNHTFNTTVAADNDPIVGEITDFLNTPTDKITAHVAMRDVIPHAPAPALGDYEELPFRVEIFRVADNSVKWRIVDNYDGYPTGLQFLARTNRGNIKEVHFSLIITAINT